MTVVVYCQDPGGTNNVLPVAAELRRRGHEVLLFVNGKAIEILESIGEQNMLVVSGVESAIEQLRSPGAVSLFLTTMNAPPDFGAEMVPGFRRKHVPTVAISDIHEGGQRLSQWKNHPEHWPDLVCVGDTSDCDLLLWLWDGFDPALVRITGFPSFDRFAALDSRKMRRDTRARFEITDDEFVILFCGQIPYTGEALQKCVAVLNAVGRSVVLIARKHPRLGTTPDSAGELAHWDKALSEFRVGRIVDSSTLSGGEVIAASDLTVGINSTMQRDGAIWKIPSISIRDHIPEKDRTSFPWIELGCIAESANDIELEKLIKKAFSGDLGRKLGPRQEDALRPDGKNASRVADVIEQACR